MDEYRIWFIVEDRHFSVVPTERGGVIVHYDDEAPYSPGL
jgi:hypothetical protein